MTSTTPNPRGRIRVAPSILSRAKSGDAAAIEIMFRQFVPEDETIVFCAYLGVQGVWGLGTHSFGCLTDRRVATARLGPMSAVEYQDGMLSEVNSSVVYQPSLLGLAFLVSMLYVLGFFLMYRLADVAIGASRYDEGWGKLYFVTVVGGLLVGSLLLPMVVRLYYRYVKCGAVFCIREGVAVYLFANRSLLSLALGFVRESSFRRAQVVAVAGHP